MCCLNSRFWHKFMKFTMNHAFKIFQIPFQVTKRGRKQNIFQDSKSITSQLSNAHSTVLLCVLDRKISLVVQRLASQKMSLLRKIRHFYHKNRFFQFALCCHGVFTIEFGPAQGCRFDPKTESAHQATFLRKSNFLHKNGLFIGIYTKNVIFVPKIGFS